jgi:hypothetical protein
MVKKQTGRYRAVYTSLMGEMLVGKSEEGV